MCAVEMVIPRFRSSGALSIEPYSRKLANPFSACLLVIAADRVVCHTRGLARRESEPRYRVLGLADAYLAVIDVANRTDVDVRLRSLKDGVGPGEVESASKL